MGLASLFVNLGVSIETAVGQIATRTGHVPLQWPAGEDTDSIIHRLPRDPHIRASMFTKGQSIIVSQGEAAVVLEDGKPFEVLEPGLYRFERNRVVGILDVIWIKTGQRTIKWGLGNVNSSDGIVISATGELYLRVADGTRFVSDVIQGNMTFADVDLQRFLLPRVQGVLRTVVAQTPALGLQVQREAFTDAIRSRLSESLATMGLAIVDFEAVEVNFPPEFKAAIAQAALNQHAGQADLIRAQADAQIAQIRAGGEAGAHLTTGMANLQLLAAMQAQGIDPLRMKALEALQTFAETPSEGGGLISGDAAKAQLFGQLAGAALAGSMGPVMPPPQVQLPPQGQIAAEASTPAAEVTAQDLQRQIDGLTARLAEGKLSEETYNRLVAGLEKRLQAMGGA